MAAAFLGRRLGALGVPAQIRSAGIVREAQPPPDEVLSVMAGARLDVSGHRSRVVAAADLAGADLVLVMSRGQVRHAAVTFPAAWPRAFTLKELVRRGEQIGGRRRGESLGDWLAAAHQGRTRTGLLGDCPDDDVADPSGGPWRDYLAAAEEIDQLIGRLVGLCWGQDASPGPRASLSASRPHPRLPACTRSCLPAAGLPARGGAACLRWRPPSSASGAHPVSG